MKYIKLNIVLGLLLLMVFSRCGLIIDKEVDTVSEVSIYPIFDLKNGDVMVWELGKPWVEPGYSCSEVKLGENDLTDAVVVNNSELDVNKRGLYSIYYTAYNKYGYKQVKIRAVLVTTGVGSLYDISGNYTQGFGGKVKMTITKSSVNGFWDVTNINDNTDIVPTKIADLGDSTYIIVPAFYRLRVDLKEVYCKGTGKLFISGANEKIEFSIMPYFFETGVNLIPEPKKKTWNKVK